MIRIPRPPQSIGGDMLRWAREVNEFLAAREEISSPNTLLSRTTRGAARSALSGGDGGASGELIPIDQWVKTNDYIENDVVFCLTTTERDDGTQAGAYQAKADVPGDVANTHPSVDTTNWRMIVDEHSQKITMRKSDQRIVLDVGRDGSDKPKITIYLDKDDATLGSVTLDIADISVGAGNKVIKLRETVGRDDSTGLCKTCLALRSDWY